MFQPYAAWFGLISTLIVCFFSGWTVFLKNSWQTDTFVTNYLPLMLFPIIYIGARLYYKQPLVSPENMDFKSDIAEIEADEGPEDPPKNMLESFWRWLDFRSTDGLYNLVKAKYPNAVVKGRDLFDSSLFRDPISTAVFYTFIAGLKSSIDNAQPSPTHRFIKTLDAKGKLLRSYTQNIDGLEERVGIVGSTSEAAMTTGGKGKGKASTTGKSKLKLNEVKNVLLHGDIHRVRCTLCSANFACEEQHLDAFRSATPLDCPECSSRSEARVARSARPLTVGILRPAIVLYDEPHPLGEEIGAIETRDLGRKPDLLIIMGTSLKVHGLKKLVKEFAQAVHQGSSAGSTSGTSKPAPNRGLLNKVIFVNKTAPGSEWADVIDYHVQGLTDTWVEKVVEDWKKVRPADWEVQTTLGESNIKVVKGLPKTSAKANKPARYAKPTARAASSSSTEHDDCEIESDVEEPMYDSESERSSPRKKRRAPDDMSLDDIVPPVMPEEERGLLFGNFAAQMVLTNGRS
ncbi:hypothetical protein FRC01_002069 [Tulasnella sp. 417]|nr:hypothetical protein FRC01_002069 [Tulasnella sp. 417]